MSIEATFEQAVKAHKNGEPLALQLYKDVLSLDFSHVGAIKNLGILLFENNRVQEAETLFLRAIRLDPQDGLSFKNLANLYRLEKQHKKALEFYKEAIMRKHHDPETIIHTAQCANICHNYSFAYKLLERLNSKLEIGEQKLTVWNDLGLNAMGLNKHDDAIEWFENIIAYRDVYSGPHGNLGLIEKERYNYEMAIKHFEKAIQLEDEEVQKATYLNSLAGTYLSWGYIEKALELYKKLIQLKPDNRLAHSNVLYIQNYVGGKSLTENKVMYEEWAEKHVSDINQIQGKIPDTDNKKLRIGFLSADFRNHPVGMFMRQLFREYDRDRAEWICFYTMGKEDEGTAFFKNYAHEFNSLVGTNDQEAANLIASKNLDMLIDLSGHAEGNRINLMAYQIAPVQASYMGYINTTGVPQIDYRITDSYVTPPDVQEAFTEKLVPLPEVFHCYDPHPHTRKISLKERAVDNNGFITFGNFNNPTKFSDQTLKAWAEILERVPNSKLLLKARHFKNEIGAQPFIERFRKLGVDIDRITFEEGGTIVEYFEAYSKVDIILDCWPHNGGTTTCDGLWMGIPTITLKGDRHVSRMGYSILRSIGHEEWVAETVDEYISKAVSLTESLAKISRQELREEMVQSILCDGENFTRQFEETVYGLIQKRRENA